LVDFPDPDPLSVFGHEVRNLIATFVGFSELLLTQEWAPEKQREFLETMRNEGVRVSQFLNELLDLQRMEAGATPLNVRRTDMTSLLRFARDVAGHDPKHPVTLDLPSELPEAMVEPDRVQQVLANLLSNARKYSPGGGPIRLSAHVVGSQLEVSVSDHGVGIPKENLERIFDKFFRVTGLAHRDIRGTGLGLAISRQIVEAHGGHIWAESRGVGHGAQVRFTLPLARVNPGPPAAAGAGSQLSSRGDHVPAHQRNGRHSRRLPRPSATESSRGTRIVLPAGDRSAED
jgi:signal transduction histidine kinase